MTDGRGLFEGVGEAAERTGGMVEGGGMVAVGVVEKGAKSSRKCGGWWRIREKEKK